MNLRVNLTKRVSIAGKDRYCPVVISGNGRVKPDWVVVDGKEDKFPGGAYYIDWTIDGKRKRASVGSDAAQALTRKLRKEAELRAESQGVTIVPQEELDKRRNLKTAAADYLKEIGLIKKKKTFQAYTTALEYFMESCRKTYVEDIERMDMLLYTVFLRDQKEQAPRSVRNKFENVMTFFKTLGITGIMRKGDWPKYVESDVETYEKEDLDLFFAACEPEELLWFQFFLMAGFREQEVIYRTWTDVNTVRGTISMRWKPEYNWTPKGYKEREVPVPTKLIVALEKVRPKKGRGLIFHTSTGKPKFDFLDCSKAISKRAGLDPEDFWLHKFRATFATWHLWAGVDIRTVQEWMGHKDLKSTLRYLRPAQGKSVQAKVNATFAL